MDWHRTYLRQVAKHVIERTSSCRKVFISFACFCVTLTLVLFTIK